MATQVFFDIFWSIGILILSVITQYESRWTQLYMIISFPTLIILFLTMYLSEQGFFKRFEDVNSLFNGIQYNLLTVGYLIRHDGFLNEDR